jgi:hypothetical protein
MTENNYIVGRIYKIKSDTTEKVYIGSTTLPLNIRWNLHKSHYKTYLDGKTQYITSIELVQYDNAYITLLFEGTFETHKSLTQLEGEYIRKTPNCVNKRIEGRTQKERNILNKDAINASKKKYDQNHKEDIDTWRKTKCLCAVCGGHYTNEHKSGHVKTKKHQNAIPSTPETNN